MEQVSSTPQANFNEAKPGGSYKITFGKIARAAAAELRVHKKIAIISYVLFGVSTLLCMFNSRFYGTNNLEGAYFQPSGWGIGFLIMGIIVGYFAALNVFRDVNNQQLCDVTMALPIKAVERYLSKMLALFCLQVGPLLIATLGGNGIAMLFGKIYYGGLGSEAPETLAYLVFGALSCSLFIMASAVLCTCCCGAPAESAYFSLIFMFVINSLPSTFVNSIISQCSGFVDVGWFFGGGDNGLDVQFWGFLPLFSGGYTGKLSDYIFHNAVSIAISLVVFFLAIFIYKRRDARTVGTPVASRIFFEVMMALGCFTLFSFFVLTTTAWWGVLVAGILYLIINVIVSRAKINIMSFFTWLVKYTVTTVAFVALMVMTIKTGGFGQMYSRPAAKYLENAQFSISYYDRQHNKSCSLTTGALTADQADTVMKICKKHIVKGRSELSAASILVNGGFYKSTTTITVRANSNEEITTRPSPLMHFNRNTVYVKNSDMWYVVYHLNYYQSLRISLSESRALLEELESLDFINSDAYDDDRIYYDDDPYFYR